MSPGLILGVMVGACSAKPPPEQPDTLPNPPLVCPTGPGRLEIHAPLSGWPGRAGGQNLLAAGDFDGNGTVDLMGVSARLYSQSSLVLGPGRGDGTFDPPTEQLVQGRLLRLTPADLDKDGDLDLVSPDDEALALRVLMNDGTGHFTQQALLGLAGASDSVTLADVDGDGALDALSPQQTRNLLTVWRTAGTGTFSTREDIPTHKNPYAVAAADLDGDGRPELVVANASGEPLEVFNMEGFSGEPTSHTETAVGNCRPMGLAVADLDRDTDIDVALSCNGLTVLRNDGRAQLTVGERHAFPGGSFGIVATDLDADGAPDLVMDHSAHGPVLFKGSGNGSFLYRETLASRHSTGADPYFGYGNGLAVIDATGDGLLDILTKAESSSEDNVAVFRGDGRGGFAGPKAMLFDSGVASYALGDLDGDGRADVIGHGMAFLALPEGGFQSVPSDFDGLGGAFSGTLNVVDANEDGRSDMVVVTPNGISIWLSDGQKPVLDSTLPSSGSNQFNGMLDVDHDGIKDLLLAHQYARGLGQGRFSPPADFPATRFVARPFFADFNGDGQLDVAGTYEVLVCNGGHCTGTRRVTASYVWDASAKRYARVMTLAMGPIAAADVTGDGNVDLLSNTQLLRGLGDGRFSETPEPLPPLSLLQQAQLKLRPHLYTAEVNGDGAMDVLEFRGSWVDVTLGTGNGEQGPTVTFYAPGFGDSSYGDAGFEDALSLDMDGDCLPELVHLSRQGIAVFKFTTR